MVIYGNEKQRSYLMQLALRGTVSSPLLLSGPEGIGKRLAALEMARVLLCPAHSAVSDGCKSCSLWEAKTHPDLIVVQQEAAESKKVSREKEAAMTLLERLSYVRAVITIEQIKELSNKAMYAPTLDVARVCLIDGVEKLTVEAANSLLKLLEEPPAYWQFILLASEVRGILPTILSRVIKVPFMPLKEQEVERVLIAQGVADARILSVMAEGSPGRALYLAQAQGIKLRQEALEFLRLFPHAQLVNALAALPYQSGMTSSEGKLYLEMLLLLLRDGLLLKEHVSEGLINRDLLEELAFLKKWPATYIMRTINYLSLTQKALDKYVSVKTALEELALKINILWEDEAHGNNCRYPF